MPVCKLEFNLPEELEEFNTCMKASAIKYALDEYDNFLRNKLKYTELTEDQHKCFSEARSKLHELISDY